jgi:hypothetical protein
MVAGAILQPNAATLPVLMMVAKAVARAPTCTDRLSGSTALTSGEETVTSPAVFVALSAVASCLTCSTPSCCTRIPWREPARMTEKALRVGTWVVNQRLIAEVPDTVVVAV